LINPNNSRFGIPRVRVYGNGTGWEMIHLLLHIYIREKQQSIVPLVGSVNNHGPFSANSANWDEH
jgi:hypothetical protein